MSNPRPKERKKRENVKHLPVVGIDVRFLHYVKPYRKLFALIFVLLFLVAFFDVIAPWPLKFIIDNVINGRPFKGTAGLWIEQTLGDDKRWQAAMLGLALLFITLLQGLANFGYQYLLSLAEERATYSLRSAIFQYVEHLPLQFFDQNRIGDLLKRVTQDSGKVMVALVGSMGELTINAFKFIGFAGVMLFVNWRFSIIVLTYVPLILFLYITFRNNIRATARDARKIEGEMMNMTLETLGAIREVKAFGRESYQLAQFEEHGRKRIRSVLNSIRWEASFSPVIDFVQAVSTAAIVWYGVSQVLQGQFTVGELLIFMAYLKDMYRPLRRFSKLTTAWQKAAASGERLGKIMDVNYGIKENENALTFGKALGAITFRDVSFAYPSAENRPILQNLNLHVKAGQVVALVGSTGSGKSTISNLLLRFYDVTSGAILLDGHDIRDLNLADLRRQFAIVPQESVLFARSIRDNIAYARPDASDEHIFAVAKAANAHEFIQQLPNGYDTIVGERGASLSGGQRQRIAIARALLCNARILILDEPTAALDAKSEDTVMHALEQLMQGRTTFVIAHRLSTVRKADLIVVLDQGRIVEQGTHEQLLAQASKYAHLVELQMGNTASEPEESYAFAG